MPVAPQASSPYTSAPHRHYTNAPPRSVGPRFKTGWGLPIHMKDLAATTPEQRTREMKFAKIIKCAIGTTAAGQGFYKKEYEQAIATMVHAATLNAPSQTHDAEEITDAAIDTEFCKIVAYLDELKKTGDTGLNARLLQDLISAGVSIGMLATIIPALVAEDAYNTGDYSAANRPTGKDAGDWALVIVEVLKGLITRSLSPLTLMRHHLVEENQKRLAVCILLLKACLDDPSVATLKESVSVGTRAKKIALQVAEKGRDFATVCTFANAALPLARSWQYVAEMVSGDPAHASLRGMFRVASHVCDGIVRVGASSMGTWARNKLFGLEFNRIGTALPDLREQFRYSEIEHRALLLRMEKTTFLISTCDTELLNSIAASPERNAEFLSADITSMATLQAFLDAEQIPFTANHNGTLSSEAPENHWGKKFVDGKFRVRPGMIARAPYRCSLEVQRLMGHPAEKIAGAIKRKGNKNDAAPESVAVGLARPRRF
ncbi:hypothetical protein ACVBEF_09775 [Glaciimonas sp. GG7]